MSMVRFATNCDVCGSRSEEYGSWPICRECGCHICPKCEVSGCHDDEGGSTWCKTCAGEDE